MKITVFAISLCLATLAGGYALKATPAFADPTCTCSTQNDGSKWCTCVGDDGKTFCKTCDQNGACSTVPCTN